MPDQIGGARRYWVVNIATFARWVHVGLGRAPQALRRGLVDPEAARAVILDAALNWHGYDAQLDGSRGRYAADLIRLSGEPHWYVPKLLAALDSSDCFFSQVFETLAHLTADRAADLRCALYDTFTRRFLNLPIDSEDRMDGADALLALDSGAFFRHLLALDVRRPLIDEERWRLDALHDDLIARDGKRAARDAVGTDSALRIALTQLRQIEREGHRQRRLSRPAPAPAPTFERILDALTSDAAPSSLHSLARWGRRADPETFQRLAALGPSVIGDDDATRRWLRLFRHRPFPLDPEPILALIGPERDYVSWEALLALDGVAHPAVGAFGRKLAESDHPFWPAAVRLLTPNRTAGDLFGDDDRVQRHLTRARNAGVGALHHAGCGFLDYLEAHPDASLTGAALTFFAEMPCSHCRKTTLSRLIEQNAAPDWLLQECVWDACEAVRETARDAGGGC